MSDELVDLALQLGGYGTLAGGTIYGMYVAGKALLQNYVETNKRLIQEIKAVYDGRIGDLEGTLTYERAEKEKERELMSRTTDVTNNLLNQVGKLTDAISKNSEEISGLHKVIVDDYRDEVKELARKTQQTYDKVTELTAKINTLK